ncbi:MAG: hypothetical protein HY821_22645 [Acidobacteria bacterium]|nr:hypothetical protein [Acidobacteriota bacterium]
MRLEERRGCGWLKPRKESGRIVWARGGAATAECPRSAITAQSAAWLELFAAWKWTGLAGEAELTARDVDALAILNREWERSRNDER